MLHRDSARPEGSSEPVFVHLILGKALQALSRFRFSPEEKAAGDECLREITAAVVADACISKEAAIALYGMLEALLKKPIIDEEDQQVIISFIRASLVESKQNH